MIIDYNHDHDMEDMLSMQQSKYYETYVKLSKSRAIFLTEDFSKDMASALTALLFHFDHQSTEEDITIYIHSDGGDSTALTNIYDVMQMIKAPVSTVCLGKAYSAGAFLLASGAKGKRCAMPHSEIMIHGIQCQFPAFGEEHPVNSKNYFDFLNDVNDNIMKILAKHTGHLLDKVKQDCAKDLYLTAKEALAYGIIDEILD